jgi:hypothetical protein
MQAAFAVIVTVCSATIALADDFKTIDGKEYKNVTVKRVEPDGIVVSSKSGISKVYFAELPKEVQQRFGYNPEKATAYTAEQNAALEQARKQQEEAMRQKAEADAKRNQNFTEEESAKQAAKRQQANSQASQALQARYAELQQQEDNLLLQIGEARTRRYRDPLRAQLPLWESHLDQIRDEKNQVKRQLEQLQR